MFEKIDSILGAESTAMHDLAIVAGGDPEEYFLDFDFTEFSLRGVDLRKVAISPQKLDGSQFDRTTQADLIYFFDLIERCEFCDELDEMGTASSDRNNTVFDFCDQLSGNISSFVLCKALLNLERASGQNKPGRDELFKIILVFSNIFLLTSKKSKLGEILHSENTVYSSDLVKFFVQKYGHSNYNMYEISPYGSKALGEDIVRVAEGFFRGFIGDELLEVLFSVTFQYETGPVATDLWISRCKETWVSFFSDFDNPR